MITGTSTTMPTMTTATPITGTAIRTITDPERPAALVD
jgi:hypothetical protein